MAIDTVTFLNEVRNYIVGLYPTIQVFVSKIPENPETCVAVINSGSVGGRIESDPMALLQTQIIYRSTSFASGVSIAQDIFSKFDGKTNILSTIKARCESQAPFFGMNYLDNNNRVVFPMNFNWRLIWV